MSATTRLALGALVVATDGACGLVKSLAIDPAARRVVHLVVEPEDRIGLARLVPVKLVCKVEADADYGVDLDCDLAAFAALPMAETSEMVRGVNVAYVYVPCPAPLIREVHEVMPSGEASFQPVTSVWASDGQIGKVAGFEIDTQGHEIVSVLVSEGRFPWGHRTVAFPITCVSSFDGEVGLNMTVAEATQLARAERQ